ncbi:MAG: type VI secretion system protein TssL [Desulfobacteraceae bacterium]|nr:MAG: type VI secretion system protein TssL [Desulfobacteraceae bacterium]
MGMLQEQETPKIDKGAPRWVVTFGDLMSLLLCFFVLLLSFSEMDRKKYKQVAGSLEQAFGVQRKIRVMEIPKGMKIIAKDFDQEIIETRILEDIGKEIDDMLSSQLEEFKEQIALEAGENEITIRLMGESTFDSGRDEIREKLKPLLGNLAKVLEKADGDVIISGHTDNVPVRSGPFKSNLRLSIARAAAVADYMLVNSRIDPKRVSTMGFGEYRPIESNITERGREMNRRVEIILSNLPPVNHQRK